jgi:hypothetical protein
MIMPKKVLTCRNCLFGRWQKQLRGILPCPVTEKISQQKQPSCQRKCDVGQSGRLGDTPVNLKPERSQQPDGESPAARSARLPSQADRCWTLETPADRPANDPRLVSDGDKVELHKVPPQTLLTEFLDCSSHMGQIEQGPTEQNKRKLGFSTRGSRSLKIEGRL